ncbi:MAG: phosphoglycerate kinase [archaeon]
MIDGIMTIDDLDFKGKTTFVRVDLNCPIDIETDKFLDDRRIIKHAETLKELSKKGAKVVVLAHQGRPGNDYDFTSLKKHAARLNELGLKVEHVPDIIGPTACEKIKGMKDGEIILLENVRFLSEELLKRPPDVQSNSYFIRALAPLGDIFVSDAFAAAHRSQPSMVGFTELLPSTAGRVMQNEFEMLTKVITSKKKPSVFVVGGSKVKTSLKSVEQYLEKKIADKILTGGLVANIFLIAKGYEIRGLEYMEDYPKLVEQAKNLLNKYGTQIEVPMDVAVDKHGQRLEVSLSELPLPYRIADIGTGTIGRYKYILETAGTIVANGPMGIFEEKNFAKGTHEIVKAVAESKAFTVVGGGHIATAVVHLGLEDKITHISTGGGACLSFLAGEDLIAFQTLRNSAKKFKGGKNKPKED